MWLTAVCCLFLLSCHKRDSNAPQLVLQDATHVQAKLLACAPTAAEPDLTGTKLEIIAANNTAEATEVRVRVTAPDHPVEFHFPAYRLSAGRWLIDGRQRAYLVDEACRQFKLKDRREVGTRIPPDGRVSLRAGQQMEGVLLFPRLFDETRFALLVYGDERFMVTVAPTN